MGVLYLCSTPLGNLNDVTRRVLDVLSQVDLIAAEDTRQTRKLLNHYGITAKTTSYHEHNEREKASYLLAELTQGKEIALVSDAGTPAISDPGFFLIKQALAAGHQITVLPGPSAVISALVVSGFTPHPFYFVGFLPRKKGERQELLQELAENLWTGVFYESPRRLRETLKEFCSLWGEQRRVAVVRELTKKFEEVFRGTFAEALDHFSAAPLGEITLVVEGKQSVEDRQFTGDYQAIQEGVDVLVRAGAGVHDACKGVARALGLSKSQVYKAYHEK
ncbi:MAG: 16S rRNA (cytidine(1402)-2'-O)-methyltransferase [Syntrophaceticus sp.]|mgnify:CR=1 FL=1|jgi:16S rRNA (cytidine1402-2'-O)-methyltransferase|nr:16S rRNA (cytidine(1402)-2'-O)-methyltransferase [Syntrophaceticus sp.]MDD3314520.1 16S rRNA (cytidine(1402)-2'-O)-methyltransferase [Syntrophaceticus sp.]MDD4359460.1 16S rRNA (cytidine(1402)-2'-O)-methyltransferase [Syntrophaceticus sp.]MDD4783304.1 16S rRNA (cytidine(1402)-2'-O)-methyltransferase [Syntrophaceticus sp.]HBG22458.1 16S rRNA (cytidine(1402)-2'-O)-methyltransferase [Peptococcaceae bacterium]